ncbi:MAG: phosphatase [Pirellula sp.]|nr:phosphatase [Pirellula sp.]
MSDVSRIRGVVFDMDGTLVDSALDFDAMRAEMGLPAELPILETIASLVEHEAERCREILHRHEHGGAERAVVMRGAVEFLRALDELGVRRAVWTRNSRAVALATLRRTGLEFETVLARDDAPAKPDPAALIELARAWDLPHGEILVIGDYVFDMEAGRRAGSRTALYTAGAAPHACAGHELADFHFACFSEVGDLLQWMGYGKC